MEGCTQAHINRDGGIDFLRRGRKTGRQLIFGEKKSGAPSLWRFNCKIEMWELCCDASLPQVWPKLDQCCVRYQQAANRQKKNSIPQTSSFFEDDKKTGGLSPRQTGKQTDRASGALMSDKIQEMDFKTGRWAENNG